MIHIYKSKNNQYYVVVKARNGYVLSTSETFKTKAAAIKNIRALIKVVMSEKVINDHTTNN